MSEDVIIRYGAPTLADIKTGSLFGYPCVSDEEARRDIREMNKLLSPKGILAIPLCYQKNRVLLYLYRPKRLYRDLTNHDAMRILKNAGYSCKSPEVCVATLCRRFKEHHGFPHEIGLFLSYPSEDVEGFIKNKAKNYKYIGEWKVYGDLDLARQCFSRYKKCTGNYIRLHANGKTLAELTVCTRKKVAKNR